MPQSRANLWSPSTTLRSYISVKSRVYRGNFPDTVREGGIRPSSPRPFPFVPFSLFPPLFSPLSSTVIAFRFHRVGFDVGNRSESGKACEEEEVSAFPSIPLSRVEADAISMLLACHVRWRLNNSLIVNIQVRSRFSAERSPAFAFSITRNMSASALTPCSATSQTGYVRRCSFSLSSSMLKMAMMSATWGFP